MASLNVFLYANCRILCFLGTRQFYSKRDRKQNVSRPVLKKHGSIPKKHGPVPKKHGPVPKSMVPFVKRKQ